MKEEKIEIIINLKWSKWFHWDEIRSDARKKGLNIPNESGVYEVKYKYCRERLTIGKASNLRIRIKQGLVKGKIPHSSGEKIRDKDTDKIVIRWATTDRPSAAEEELHKRYLKKFNKLPRYVKHT